MITYFFHELSERAQENVVNLYYADSAYQEFVDEVNKENPDDFPTVEDWASAKSVRFTEHGERVA